MKKIMTVGLFYFTAVSSFPLHKLIVVKKINTRPMQRHFCSALQVNHILEPLKKTEETITFKKYIDANVCFMKMKIFNEQIDSSFYIKTHELFKKMKQSPNLIESHQRFSATVFANIERHINGLPLSAPVATEPASELFDAIQHIANLKCSDAILDHLSPKSQK